MSATPDRLKLRSTSAVLKDWVRALENTEQLRAATNPTLTEIVRARAAATPDAPALLGVQTQLSYAQLIERADRTANWALAQNLAPGDVVALLLPNQPDYIALWLGLTQIGCVVALLNTNLMPDAIAHCLAAANAKHLIVAPTLRGRVQPSSVISWSHGNTTDLPDINPAIAACPAIPPHDHIPAARDRALLIYTSGTTGLPKAAFVTHARILEWSGWFAGMMDAQPTDRLYDCLPLYHSTGGVVAIGAMLHAGASIVIRDRFSASAFWSDITDTNCTIVQYIGELCRYLLQSPLHPKEHSHHLRLLCGNGLRGDVWEAFQCRFAIPRILEFYAATEGSVSLYNCEGKPGAIGRVPAFLAHRFPVAIIRIDLATGEPLRDESGHCIRCDPDEPGEAIGQILTDTDTAAAARRFDGYTDRKASAKKILTSAFAPGDQWFRTGDLMRKDAAGYIYFVDRLGDTFRWKGENVSTADVASTLGFCPGVQDAVVYGVTIPHTEGRAGMAALAVDESFDIAEFKAITDSRLPSYARPVFVRLVKEIAKTGTMKLSKAELITTGYDDCSDLVWFHDKRRNAYVRLDDAIRRAIKQEEALLF